MKILILGGTKFLGRHLVEQAREAGDTVTLFHRGTGGCTLFPEVEHVHGDRDGQLDRLGQGRWDVAIDTSGYVPRLVGDAARFLADRVEHYTFVSTISVFKTFVPGMNEDAPLAELEDPAVETIDGETYGGLKVLCERAAEAALPGRVHHVRAGLIVGPHDPTDRFTYWVRRIPMGGRVLIPAPEDRPIQIIHAGDLAGWILAMARKRRPGTFLATGPRKPHTMADLVAACRQAGGGNAEPVWVTEDFLKEREVAFWSELPLCVESGEIGVLAVDTSRAEAEGLTQRSLLHTVRDTLAWDVQRPVGTELGAGLTAGRETDLLAAWDARTRS